MRRLSGLDATFLYSETPTTPMHTLKVAVLEPPEDAEASFEQFREELERRMHLLPPFRLRALPVPLGLHHPVWAEDPELDIARHLFRARIPAPGTRRQMDDVIAGIAADPLPRDRPLWQIWMLEGLESGETVYVGKVHHSIADGAASVALMANVMTPADPDAPASVAPPPLPSDGRLLYEALADWPGRFFDVPPLLARTARGGLEMARRARGGQVKVARPFATDRLPFNVELGARRTFATADVPLATLKAVKAAHGVTLNDVILALVGEAVARYLADEGVTLGRPLVATVPVGVGGAGGGARLGGNELSNVFASLHTDEPDFGRRLRAIHDGMEAAKENHRALGPAVMRDWAEYAPPGPYRLGFRLYTGLRFADRHRPAANLIVSNVRGPASPLEVGGARMSALYSVGPVMPGLGLNITAWSYAGKVGFTALAAANAVPDPHRITDRLPSVLAEMGAGP